MKHHCPPLPAHKIFRLYQDAILVTHYERPDRDDTYQVQALLPLLLLASLFRNDQMESLEVLTSARNRNDSSAADVQEYEQSTRYSRQLRVNLRWHQRYSKSKLEAVIHSSCAQPHQSEKQPTKMDSPLPGQPSNPLLPLLIAAAPNCLTIDKPPSYSAPSCVATDIQIPTHFLHLLSHDHLLIPNSHANSRLLGRAGFESHIPLLIE